MERAAHPPRIARGHHLSQGCAHAGACRRCSGRPLKDANRAGHAAREAPGEARARVVRGDAHAMRPPAAELSNVARTINTLHLANAVEERAAELALVVQRCRAAGAAVVPRHPSRAPGLLAAHAAAQALPRCRAALDVDILRDAPRALWLGQGGDGANRRRRQRLLHLCSRQRLREPLRPEALPELGDVARAQRRQHARHVRARLQRRFIAHARVHEARLGRQRLYSRQGQVADCRAAPAAVAPLDTVPPLV